MFGSADVEERCRKVVEPRMSVPLGGLVLCSAAWTWEILTFKHATIAFLWPRVCVCVFVRTTLVCVCGGGGDGGWLAAAPLSCPAPGARRPS